MPGPQDYNIFRRYIGDFNTESVDDDEIDQYLDDATAEATAPHTMPDVLAIVSYDLLPQKYAPEVILLGAINWWWNKAASYADKLTTTVGQAAEQASDRYQHALQMIQTLLQRYDLTKALGHDPDVGDLSHWNRNTLTRVGGQSEEDAKKSFIPWLP